MNRCWSLDQNSFAACLRILPSAYLIRLALLVVVHHKPQLALGVLLSVLEVAIELDLVSFCFLVSVLAVWCSLLAETYHLPASLPLWSSAWGCWSCWTCSTLQPQTSEIARLAGLDYLVISWSCCSVRTCSDVVRRNAIVLSRTGRKVLAPCHRQRRSETVAVEQWDQDLVISFRRWRHNEFLKIIIFVVRSSFVICREADR